MIPILAIFAIVLSIQSVMVHGDTKNGDATYYNLGMTACGETYSDNDLVAAVSGGYWTTDNPNLDPICQRSATVTDPASGNSVNVLIKDKCGGCSDQDIDLSPAAFQQLKDLSVGRFQVNWDFN